MNAPISSFRYESLPGQVIFGAGSSRTQLAPAVAQLGLRRLLLLASEREAARAEGILQPLGETIAGSFSDVVAHIPQQVADAARLRARETGADGLLAIGGGAAIGVAKAVALDLALPIVAVPTTYAGSEMTPIYGITSDGRKQTGRSAQVLPKLVIYDPELLRALSPGVAAPSAMNALAHSIEALYAPGRNPVTATLALESIGRLARGIVRVIETPDDADGQAEALYGAYLAGAALAVAGTGIHHKICHALGGAYNLPHAALHAALLPHTVAFNAVALPETMAQIAAALGAPGGDAGGALHALALRIGAPTSLAVVGLRAEDLDEAAALALAAVPPDNPRRATLANIRALLERAALKGNVFA